MLIFIDESGSFTYVSGLTGIALVGALIIPEGRIEQVVKKYNAIRARLPKQNGEVKGRMLSEAQVDCVVTMLAKNETLFEVVAIDMAVHSSDGIDTHKKAQENGITINLTAELHPNVQEQMWSLRHRLECMSHQLYVQSVSTFELIATVVKFSTLYFSQRRPETLGQFQWVIDGKDKRRVTDWEDWLSFAVMAATQSRSFQEPISQLVEGDYSYFQRFETAIPEHLWPHLKNPAARTGLDAKKILTENFRFSSAPEPGLEMVDILTNATRRALVGNLGKQGWVNIPRLMIHRNNHYIQFIHLTDAPKGHHYPYMNVLSHFSQEGKTILAPRFR